MKKIYFIFVVLVMSVYVFSCAEEPVLVSSLALECNTLELTEGEEYTLLATVLPENAENKELEWFSSDAYVASVADGVVTAIKPGMATVTVETKDGSKKATCSVTVVAKEIAVTNVILNQTSVDLAEGEEYTLLATVLPESATNKNISWSSSDSSVATVEDGRVTAMKTGTSTIVVTTLDGDKTAQCVVTVFPFYTDMSECGTANSYIVSQAGYYKIKTVKGNSEESVGEVVSAEVVWESFGTDVIPEVGDLINDVFYSDGYICFSTNEAYQEGNAVIAAKDGSGNILWSWHIWMTDVPAEQVYYNDAGTMMDRNLGATSATPGDVGALGLLYQWGRKDPFLGSSSISSSVFAESTISWPSSVSSDSSTGTIEYTIANPTTFINSNYENSNYYDWHYTGDETADNIRWTESDKSKSIYDPCPDGWRVPDGGENGIWSKALGFTSSYTEEYDKVNEGINFSGIFGSDQTIWYPASGHLHGSGKLLGVNMVGYFWSASRKYTNMYILYIGDGGLVLPLGEQTQVSGLSVRCCRELE